MDTEEIGSLRTTFLDSIQFCNKDTELMIKLSQFIIILIASVTPDNFLKVNITVY